MMALCAAVACSSVFVSVWMVAYVYACVGVCSCRRVVGVVVSVDVHADDDDVDSVFMLGVLLFCCCV